jgi:hypothetical protein
MSVLNHSCYLLIVCKDRCDGIDVIIPEHISPLVLRSKFGLTISGYFALVPRQTHRLIEARAYLAGGYLTWS